MTADRQIIRQENQIAPSDRIDLLEAAVSFMSIMVRKQTSSSDRSYPSEPLELSREEKVACNAALGLLTTEFDRGPKLSEMAVKSVELAETKRD